MDENRGNHDTQANAELPLYDELFDQEHPVDPPEIVAVDGVVEIDTSSGLFRTLTKLIERDLNEKAQHAPLAAPPVYSKTETNIRLNICIQIVGSRGDIQPFLALGVELIRRGHRVRVATHDVFKAFVLQSGLEFFPVGGDPTELMSYMVRNPGLMPSMKSIREGEVQKKRKMMASMLHGFWASCISNDPDSGRPFIADAIIANPPGFAHVHCAQALGVPLHMMFTMPWSSTRAFPHPLVRLNFKDSGIPEKMANYVSYAVVDWITWQGLGGIINDWRHSIDLEPVPWSEGPQILSTLNISYTYCWSAALIPKPEDWSTNIDVTGFMFREEPQYTPDQVIQDFLNAGPQPIYIGFGSIVVEDPESLTQILLESVKGTGVRAIISKGWSKLGSDVEADSNVLFIDDCPHEWLFKHVSTVIHHGGAGTTACGLKCEKPTIIVPFFGDQPFWGKMVAEAGAGPDPVPYKKLNQKNLSEAIRFCDQDDVRNAAKAMARKMETEYGVQDAADSFIRNLPLDLMACSVLPNHPACWQYKKNKRTMLLSTLAAEKLIEQSVIQRRHLSRYESRPVQIEKRRWEPLTAFTSSFMGLTTDVATSTANIVMNPVNVYRQDSSKGNSKDGNRDIEQPETADQPGKTSAGGKLLKASAGSGKALAGVFGALSKGMLVDIPLAAAEGFRAVPRMYGSEVEDPGAVTDWKTGAVAGGKSLVYGIGHGLADLYKEPAAGAKKNGVVGGIAGFGTGVLSMSSKLAYASAGLAAYPGQGLLKTIKSAAYSTRRKAIQKALQERGEDDLKTNSELGGEVLRAYNVSQGCYDTT